MTIVQIKYDEISFVLDACIMPAVGYYFKRSGKIRWQTEFWQKHSSSDATCANHYFVL